MPDLGIALLNMILMFPFIIMNHLIAVLPPWFCKMHLPDAGDRYFSPIFQRNRALDRLAPEPLNGSYNLNTEMLHEPTMEESAYTSSVSSTHPPMRILLVDDDADLRKLYAHVLTISGYEVDTAEDGEAGWHVLYAESFTPDGYDLLITDNSMPKLTGVGLIKKVRSAGLNLPIILASGNAPDDVESLRLAAVLPKPFMADDLLQTIEKVFHLHATRNKKSPSNQ